MRIEKKNKDLKFGCLSMNRSKEGSRGSLDSFYN